MTPFCTSLAFYGWFAIYALYLLLSGHLLTIVEAHGGGATTLNRNNRTNFLIYLVDDLGWAEVGYNGGKARTPFVDALAGSPHSLQLRNMHSTTSCSPSRAELVTGLSSLRNCVSGTNLNQTMKAPVWMQTIGTDAQRAAYKTAYFGKWHLGLLHTNMIANVGFNHWVASSGNLVPYDSTCYCQEITCSRIPLRKCVKNPACRSIRSAPGSTVRICSAFATTKECDVVGFKYKAHFHTFRTRQSCDWTTNSIANGTAIGPANMPRRVVAAHDLVDRFGTFLKGLNDDEAFLAIIAFSEVHLPLASSTESRRNVSIYHQVPLNSLQADYLTSLENLDAAVGRAQSMLVESGRMNNTFVIFTSDNGPQDPTIGGPVLSAPLRGWKSTIYEGGVRVPGIIHWPNRISFPSTDPSRVISQLIALVDIRPTIRDILLAENPSLLLPSLDNADGESLLSLIESPRNWTRRRDHVICLPPNLAIGRIKDCEKFAFYPADIPHLKAVVARTGSKFPERDREAELFDLKRDLAERRSLVSQQVQVYRGLAKRGRNIVKEIMAEFQQRKCSDFTI